MAATVQKRMAGAMVAAMATTVQKRMAGAMVAREMEQAMAEDKPGL